MPNGALADLDPLTLSLDEVAHALGRPVPGFRQGWRKLVAEHRFPEPLPGRPRRWSTQAIRHWIDYEENRRPPPPPANDGTDPALIAKTRQRLAELMQ